MGRQKILKSSDLKKHWMECQNCTRIVEVMRNDIVEVTCEFCLNGVIPMNKYNMEALDELERDRLTKENDSKKDKPKRKYTKKKKSDKFDLICKEKLSV